MIFLVPKKRIRRVITCFLVLFYTVFPYSSIFSQGFEIPRINLVLKDIRDFMTLGMRNYFSTNPGVINVQVLPDGILRVEAVGQGNTFLHIWDGNGRESYEIVVSGFKSTPSISKYRTHFNPEGSRFSFSSRVSGDYSSSGGLQTPFFEHEFEANIPLKNQKEWKTVLRGFTDTRIKNGPEWVPFSQATEPTFMLSYLKTKNFLIGAGDIFFTSSELSPGGFPIRGGAFQFYRNKSKFELFGGWSRPIYGIDRFDTILSEKTFGFSASQEIFPNIFIKPYFVYFKQDHSNGLSNDFVSTLEIEAKPIKDKFNLEFEYGRSRHDNAYRGILEYTPYWGKVLATYRRIGSNYINLSRGFILKNFEDGMLNIDFQPYRKIGVNLNYFMSHFGLDNTSTSFSHSLSLSSRYKKNKNTDYIGILSGGISHGNLSSNRQKGSFIYQKRFTDGISNLYLESYAEHRKQDNQFNFKLDQFGGGLNYRQDFLINKNMKLHTNGAVEAFKTDRKFLNTNKNSTTFSLSTGANFSYSRPIFNFNIGSYYSFGKSEANTSQSVQPSFSINYTPSQALNVSGKSNLVYNFNLQSLDLIFTGEIAFRFGTGIPDTLVTTFAKKGKVYGNIFYDANGDGAYTNGEELLDHYSIQIDHQPPIVAEKGYFSSSLKAGNHTLELLTPQDSPFRLTTPNIVQIDMTPNQKLNINFGLSQGVNIQGKVLIATVQTDQIEAGLKNIKVRITDESGGTQIATTGPSGIYRSFLKKPGTYRIAVLENDLPTGYSINTPSSITQAVKIGETAIIPPFTLTAKRSLYGFVFLDINHNMIKDDEDRPLAGIQIHLGNEKVISDRDGSYLFKNVPMGSHTLSILNSKLKNLKPIEPKAILFDVNSKSIEVNFPLQSK